MYIFCSGILHVKVNHYLISAYCPKDKDKVGAQGDVRFVRDKTKLFFNDA